MDGNGKPRKLVIIDPIKMTIVKAMTNESTSPNSRPSGYSFNQKGQLIVNGYPFIRSTMQGHLKTSILWRCAEYRKHKCDARVRTVARELEIIKIEHSHAARKELQLNAIIWDGNRKEMEVDDRTADRGDCADEHDEAREQ